MSNDSIIADLEEQMASAAFNQLVEQNIGSIDITVMLAARLSNVPSDVLIVILAGIIGRILINQCPDNARQHYADIVKHIMDEAVHLSNKE